MLVLSRKLGERIVVPDCDLVVTVIAAKGNVVRLGISGPENLDVYREEVWQRVCQEEVARTSCPSSSTKKPGARARRPSTQVPISGVISIKPKGDFP